ncbi:hypothetical protein OVW21_27065, partial [Klebsiella pneumoniae]|nr:hypothetical protein [Klebsiella pneumoniae]
KAAFVEALLAEIRESAREGGYAAAAPPDTLYFGGGTPSLLAPPEIAAIIRESRESLSLVTEAEVTLEANPETIDPAFLDGIR